MTEWLQHGSLHLGLDLEMWELYAQMQSKQEKGESPSHQ